MLFSYGVFDSVGGRQPYVCTYVHRQRIGVDADDGQSSAVKMIKRSGRTPMHRS